MWLGLKKQAEIILEKAILLNPPKAPPILLSKIKMTIAYISGSSPYYLEVLINEYNKYGQSHPRYDSLLDTYIASKSGAGLANSVNKKENIFALFKHRILPSLYVFLYHFLNDLTTCNFSAIKLYFHKLNFKDPTLSIWVSLHDVLVNNNLQNEIKPNESHHFEFFNAILRINFHLIKGDLQKALEELNKKEYDLWNHVVSNFLFYTRIRVELCHKNTEAAFQLLRLKINSGNLHYMDDFFLARVELLKGNLDKASLYFHKTYLACENYVALNRLNIELNMAWEIKPSDLLFISKNISNKKTSNLEDINYHDYLVTDTLIGKNRLIGKSEEIKSLKSKITQFSDSNLPILITGEKGVGKEIVAKAIHEESSRKDEPFLTINCGAIADSLLQSELFGHMAGSFSGATSSHNGIFIEAGKGTVFLDEIGEISPAMQVALLRVLENKEVRPIGGTQQIPFKCQILLATNANLHELVENKSFREDLYYRMQRLTIVVPPLRERNLDVIPLAKYFLKQFRHSSLAPVFSNDLELALINFDWPGNIRQLKNEIEKMDLIQSRKPRYELSDCNFLSEDQIPKVSSNRIEKQNAIQQTVEKPYSGKQRLDKIIELFESQKELTRQEFANKMNISLPTATSDLKKLVKKNIIQRIEPSASSRSLYFILKS